MFPNFNPLPTSWSMYGFYGAQCAEITGSGEKYREAIRNKQFIIHYSVPEYENDTSWRLADLRCNIEFCFISMSFREHLDDRKFIFFSSSPRENRFIGQRGLGLLTDTICTDRTKYIETRCSESIETEGIRKGAVWIIDRDVPLSTIDRILEMASQKLYTPFKIVFFNSANRERVLFPAFPSLEKQ